MRSSDRFLQMKSGKKKTRYVQSNRLHTNTRKCDNVSFSKMTPLIKYSHKCCNETIFDARHLAAFYSNDSHGNTHTHYFYKALPEIVRGVNIPLLLYFSFKSSVQLMPDETTPILHHTRRRTTGADYESVSNLSTHPSRQDSRLLPSRRSSFHFMKRRTGEYDEDYQGLISENTGVRVWYENYSSIGE
jgi:hypothetical protein